MGKIPSQQVRSKDTLKEPVGGGNNDFSTISTKRKPFSNLPPVFPSEPIGRMVIEQLLSKYFAEIESIKVLSAELGWVKARGSAIVYQNVSSKSFSFEKIEWSLGDLLMFLFSLFESRNL